MRDIDEPRDARRWMEEALRAAGRGTAGYHVSLDIGLESIRRTRRGWERRCGGGANVSGGASGDGDHRGTTAGMLSLEVVEVNPVIDETQPHGGSGGGAGFRPAFGKKIL